MPRGKQSRGQCALCGYETTKGAMSRHLAACPQRQALVARAEQARLFTPFMRLQAASIPGHGLGLSIVQRIAAQLGGKVGVESSDQGCRFFFTLPATGAAPPALIE